MSIIKNAIGLAACVLMLVTGLVYAQDVMTTDTPSIDTLISKPATVKLGFESIKLPAGQSMGMVGTAYLIEAVPGIYLGSAAYGAISGQQVAHLLNLQYTA